MRGKEGVNILNLKAIIDIEIIISNGKKGNNLLTPKQEKFCQCIVSGLDGKASYLSAYNADKMKDNTVYNEAKKLLMRDDITARIKELQRPLENHVYNTSISNRQNQIAFIKSRIDLCRTKDDENSIIRYTDMLNKLYGLYNEDVKVDNKENDVVKLDTNTLQKLASIS